MEAPEDPSAAALLSAWDPDLFIDLHTTNGSYHGYVLTYAAGLNPNSNPAADFARDRLLPEVRERMQRRHRQRTFPYGNFRNQDPDSWHKDGDVRRTPESDQLDGLRAAGGAERVLQPTPISQTRITATYNFGP